MSPLTESTRVVLKQPTGASWTITSTNLLPDDADAVAYIASVEAADGEALEPAVRLAYNSFIKGCKQDGIWPSIKASCILSGAKTLTGALVPLVGAAPTNYNFVAGDYNRKTGLIGDGSTKYLDSGRAGNAAPLGDIHSSVFASTAMTSGAYLGERSIVSGFNRNSCILIASGSDLLSSVQDGYSTIGLLSAAGFIGNNRSTLNVEQARINNATSNYSTLAQQPGSQSIAIFAQNTFGTVSSHSNGRLAFYSIGESLDLALLDARVTTLINAFAAAIP